MIKLSLRQSVPWLARGTGVARAGGSSAGVVRGGSSAGVAHGGNSGGVAAACGAQRRLIEFLEGGEAQTARLL